MCFKIQLNKMFRGVFMKTLKGSAGLYRYDISRIDVAFVGETYCCKRLFMIFDQDYPFLLKIPYFESGHFAIITRRYATKQEVDAEVQEINEMKMQIHKLQEMRKKEYLSRL